MCYKPKLTCFVSDLKGKMCLLGFIHNFDKTTKVRTKCSVNQNPHMHTFPNIYIVATWPFLKKK